MTNNFALFLQFTQFLKDVKSGNLQTMVTDFVRKTKNNQGFGVTWYLDVEVEGVPEEASCDYSHAQIVTDEKVVETFVYNFPVHWFSLKNVSLKI